MDIVEQIAQLPEVPALVELFTIDLTPIGTPNVFYYTPMVGSSGYVVWDSHNYYPFPIQLVGLDTITAGAPPRAELHISNVNNDKLFGTLAFAYGDLIGALVYYRRTFSNLLNTAYASQPYKFVVSKKSTHNKSGLIFELKSIYDKDREYLPKRQMLRKDFPGLGINKRGN